MMIITIPQYKLYYSHFHSLYPRMLEEYNKIELYKDGGRYHKLLLNGIDRIEKREHDRRNYEAAAEASIERQTGEFVCHILHPEPLSNFHSTFYLWTRASTFEQCNIIANAMIRYEVRCRLEANRGPEHRDR